MRNISEGELTVFISLLSKKIRDMEEEFQVMKSQTEAMNDEQIEDFCQLQDCMDKYIDILDNLRAEYECALAEGTILPSYEELTGVHSDRQKPAIQWA